MPRSNQKKWISLDIVSYVIAGPLTISLQQIAYQNTCVYYPEYVYVHGCVCMCKGRNTPSQQLDIWIVGETWTRSGTNLFGVFSCVESIHSRSDVVWSDSTCKVWGGWLSTVCAIGFSDWLCASESERCVTGVEYCSHWFSTHSVLSFLVFMFWSTGMRLAVIMSGQDKLICVCLVMPRCMFSMQLFLSEIVKFHFDRK